MEQERKSQLPTREELKGKEIRINFTTLLSTYFVFAVLICLGYIRDTFRYILNFVRLGRRRGPRDPTADHYAPLLDDFENFFARRLYRRIEDCWNRPIASAPGTHIDVLERKSNDYNQHIFLTGRVINCLNLGSYNYLGFSEGSTSPTHEHVVGAVEQWGVAAGAARAVCHSSVVEELEQLVTELTGKPAAMVVSQGYATNSEVIPALCQPGDCIVSDSLNHASLIMGARAAGADIRVFGHNSAASLERTLRLLITEGQRSVRGSLYKPWKRIMVLVEGVYSMEGEILNLPEILRVTKKYKCYLYMDEAHSIGALGSTGRGLCEYWDIETSEVDVLMGTFTKSFASFGGYIAGSKNLIARLRARATASIHDHAMAGPAAAQALAALRIIMGKDGTDEGKNRLKKLHENTVYFRRKLVMGPEASPVVPVCFFNPTKYSSFGRETLSDHNLAVVVVGFPATPLTLGRTRVCLSAKHTKEDMDQALKVFDELGDKMLFKYDRAPPKELEVEKHADPGEDYVTRYLNF